MNFEIISTWDDVQSSIIVPHILNKSLSDNIVTTNIKSKKKLYQVVINRLKLPMYQSLQHNSVVHTLKYIFFKIRSAIFVKIHNNQLVAFIPFANKYYKNNWSANISYYGSKNNTLKEYIQHKRKYFRYTSNYIRDKKYWWANAYIINNEVREDVWGQHSLQEFYDLLQQTLSTKKVQDCMFFINKRDHPLIHKNLQEPYPNLYRSVKKIEDRYQFKSFAPILSPYSNKKYADIPFIIAEDWKLANQDSSYYKIEKEIKWEDKIPTAFFRGSATGSMELQFNQRLMITKLNNEWKVTKPTLLDAGIVSWNSRDKVDSKLQLNYIKPEEMEELGISLLPRVPMNEQIKYKYIINIDGHSKPNRTSYLLQCGSLMFIVESHYVLGDECWYSHLLTPFKHYIPIKYDLSDLEEKVLWCRSHEKECKRIVQNAIRLYQTHFTRDAIIDYVSETLNLISSQYIKKN